jgi:hypothetical protein
MDATTCHRFELKAPAYRLVMADSDSSKTMYTIAIVVVIMILEAYLLMAGQSYT